MSRTLPARPSAEFLRKEAKDLQAQHHARDPKCLATLRVLRQFKDANDEDIFTSPLPLSEVQFALALVYGFAGWNPMMEVVGQAVGAGSGEVKLPANVTKFPEAIPEIPVADVDASTAYYVSALGFTLDWGGHADGIAGLSRGICRLYLTNPPFRAGHGNQAPAMVWFNLDSKAAVDELYAEWKGKGAQIVSAPEDKPWQLREFVAADPDGNRLRVFYDFHDDLK